MSRTNLHCGRLLRAAGLLGVSLAAMPALAGTVAVPQQFPTIQAAINAANPNDVIVVAPGVYSGPGNRDLDLLGKAITLRSAGGAASCIIDASDLTGNPHSGFMLQSNETSATIIEGFTVRGGFQFNGGGFYVHNGSPTIRNCVMTSNSVVCWGGGVYCEFNSSPQFINCTIVGNSSGDEGGGFFSNGSSARVESCIISNNTASSGAGVFASGGQLQFVNCRITGNTASSWGGGMYLWSGKVVNCTIANNSAPFQSAGVYFGGGATIANSIIWGNVGSTQINTNQPGVTYSIVQGGLAGAGNSSADPRFVNAAAGDFRVLAISPAIDAGSNVLVPSGVVTDLAGGARIAQTKVENAAGGGIVDLGAFEHQGPTAPTSRSR